MGKGRDFIWARYTDNQGGFHAVKIAKHIYDLALVTAFAAFNTADKPMPRGMEMRAVRVEDSTTGASRYVPCGAVTATLWTGAATTVTLPYEGDADGEVFNRAGLREEKPARVPKVIINL